MAQQLLQSGVDRQNVRVNPRDASQEATGESNGAEMKNRMDTRVIKGLHKDPSLPITPTSAL